MEVNGMSENKRGKHEEERRGVTKRNNYEGNTKRYLLKKKPHFTP